MTSTSRHSLLGSRCASSGCPRCSSSRAAAATFASTLRSTPAYGRAAIIRSCARRSFAAETIFMALVICCVFLTQRMRRRISISARHVAYAATASALSFTKRVLELVDRPCAARASSSSSKPSWRGSRAVEQRRCAFVAGTGTARASNGRHCSTGEIVEEALGAGEDRCRICFSTRQRLILALLQDLDQALAAIELRLREPCRGRSRTARTPPARGTAPGRDAACRRPDFIALICASRRRGEPRCRR